MAFLKRNGGSVTLVHKVRSGRKWKNEKIASLCGHQEIGEAIKQIPIRVNKMQTELEEFISATAGDIQTGWHRRVIQRHQKKIDRLESEWKALRRFCDEVEVGAYQDGGGI